MTDNECKRILEYLDKNELEKLRKYVLKEKQNEYLSNARKALNKYLISPQISFFQEKGKLIISDTYSIFILNSSSVLTKNSKYKLQMHAKGESKILKELCEKFTKESYKEIKNITSRDNISFIHTESKESLRFPKRQINLIESILGEGRKYSYCDNKFPILEIETENGKCYLLGYKDK